mmetsp:Transcript_25340/g.53531  ORF Transcript_25340/g.53531 Transcript_25340/m.53531 type:complete len:348 (+) Transcript_25340:194-1237(+)
MMFSWSRLLLHTSLVFGIITSSFAFPALGQTRFRLAKPNLPRRKLFQSRLHLAHINHPDVELSALKGDDEAHVHVAATETTRSNPQISRTAFLLAGISQALFLNAGAASAKGGHGGGHGGGYHRGGGGHYNGNSTNTSESSTMSVIGSSFICLFVLGVALDTMRDTIFGPIDTWKKRQSFDAEFDEEFEATDFMKVQIPSDGVFEGYTDGQQVSTTLLFLEDGSIEGWGEDYRDGKYTISGQWCPSKARWTEVYGNDTKKNINASRLKVAVQAHLDDLSEEDASILSKHGRLKEGSNYPSSMDASYNVLKLFRDWDRWGDPTFKLGRVESLSETETKQLKKSTTIVA